MVVAVLLQMTLARYAIGGRWTFDLVLVGVLYCAIYWGAGAGILAGSVGGLAQDAFSGGILGMHGLTETIVGFAAGVVGAQFILTKAGPRMALVAGATIVHRAMLLAISGVIDQAWPGVPWTAILAETAINAFCGVLAFQLTESLPGTLQRRRLNRRTGFTRRQW